MNYERIKDCIVVVPSKAREYARETEIGEKAKKCFSIASDKLIEADEFLSRKTVADKALCALGSFTAGIFIGLFSSKFSKRLGYTMLTLSGIGLLYFTYKKLFSDK